MLLVMDVIAVTSRRALSTESLGRWNRCRRCAVSVVAANQNVIKGKDLTADIEQACSIINDDDFGKAYVATITRCYRSLVLGQHAVDRIQFGCVGDQPVSVLGK